MENNKPRYVTIVLQKISSLSVTRLKVQLYFSTI